MTALAPVWENVSWHVPAEYGDEKAFGCYLTKVFCYHTDRNAWWSTSGGEIRGYALRKKPLEDKIEGERTQGTRFNISEIPALALVGSAHDLVIFDFSRAPFKEAKDLKPNGSSLQELQDSILPPSPHSYSYSVYLSSRGIPAVPILPFKTYESYPRGAGYRLGWRVRTEQAPDISYVSSLVSQVCLHLNRQD